MSQPSKKNPNVVVVAGPNGAGKSTSAPAILKERLNIVEFVNADTIAAGLAAFAPEKAQVQAGRIMLSRIHQLVRHQTDFAFETTLAARSYARRLTKMAEKGYNVHLLFLWLPSADFAIERVADRVRIGGHDVPLETIRRRYKAGLRNFFELYRPLALTWEMLDNSDIGAPRTIAVGHSDGTLEVDNTIIWNQLNERYQSDS
jgi:predicted ABC-type ATPase